MLISKNSLCSNSILYIMDVNLNIPNEKKSLILCERCGYPHTVSLVENQNFRRKTTRHLELDDVNFQLFRYFCGIKGYDYNEGLAWLLGQITVNNPFINLEKKEKKYLEADDSTSEPTDLVW